MIYCPLGWYHRIYVDFWDKERFNHPSVKLLQIVKISLGFVMIPATDGRMNQQA